MQCLRSKYAFPFALLIWTFGCLACGCDNDKPPVNDGSDSDTATEVEGDSNTESSFPDTETDTVVDIATDSNSFYDAGFDSGDDEDTDLYECNEDKLPDPTEYFEFYEFCVEDKEEYLSEVHVILEAIGKDQYSSSKGSAGMIRCNIDTEYLFWDLPMDTPREVLCALTMLPYIERIGGGVYL